MKLADGTENVRDREWYHVFCSHIPSDISCAAIATTSLHKFYLNVTRSTTKITPSNWNTKFHDKTFNNSLYLTFIKTQDNFIGTRNVQQPDIPHVSTTQQSTLRIHFTIMTHHNINNTRLPQTTLRVTVKPTHVSIYLHMDNHRKKP